MSDFVLSLWADLATGHDSTLMKPYSHKLIYPNVPVAPAICRIALFFISAILANGTNAGSPDQVLDLKLSIANSQKGMLTLQWPASVGSTYQLQWNNNLSSPGWVSLAPVQK